MRVIRNEAGVIAARWGQLVLCCAAVCPALSARAQETSVQNDSFVSNGPAVIVGGFIGNEQAAAWLTSPCDGAIVAVQVAWLSNPDLPPADPVFGANIWIYEVGSFPVPGDVMDCGSGPCQLEAPLLTPAALNEFRFLDEGGQVPINVPVSDGQTFVVALEFSEPSDPDAGSVIRDVNGCTNNRNGIFALNLGGWINACVLLQGDFVIRAIVDCGLATGACCNPDGLCTDDRTNGLCTASGGTYQGDSSECASVECPQPLEACCITHDLCIDLTADDCDQADGVAQGFGTQCGIVQCFPVGACCLPDGTCVNDVPGEPGGVCDQAGGVFQGDGITCDLVSCAQPQGACCVGDDGCLSRTNEQCRLLPNSVWSGPQTACASSCDTECQIVTQDFDGDCDVDLSDYDAYGQCANAPVSNRPLICECFNVAGDSLLTTLDFAEFQVQFSGVGTGCP